MCNAQRQAVERYFRKYYLFCTKPDVDSLYELLSAAHSLKDRASTEFGAAMWSWDEFNALMMLRNYCHHSAEVDHHLKIVVGENLPELITDLGQIILVPIEVMLAAYDEVSDKRKDAVAKSADNVFAYFETAVSINPAIFNLTVKIALFVLENSIEIECDEFARVEKQLQFENEHGHPHLVGKGFACHAGSVDEIVDRLFTV